MTAPEDWTVYELGELFDFSNGINADKSAYGSGTPFINILEVITNEAVAVDDIPGRVTLPKSVLARYQVKQGDVLFNRTSETQEEVGLASVYVDDESVVFGGFVFRARPKTSHLDPRYVKYSLRASSVRRQIVARGQGGIRANIGQRDLKAVIVRVPRLTEQRAIADALDDVSALIRELQGLVAKKRDVKQGMMQELLTGKTRLSGFTDDWTSVTLDMLGSFLKGRGVRRDDVKASGVPCIRYGELYTTYVNYTASTVSFVEPHIAVTALPLYSGDILFAGSGETKEEIGMSVAYIGDEPAVAGGDIIVLRGAGFDPIYLASLLNTPEVANQKARGGQGDAVVHINWRVLAAIELEVPSLTEQQAIAKVLLDADTEIFALENRLRSARAVKTGMMQELLTGRTRLPLETAS